MCCGVSDTDRDMVASLRQPGASVGCGRVDGQSGLGWAGAAWRGGRSGRTAEVTLITEDRLERREAGSFARFVLAIDKDGAPVGVEAADAAPDFELVSGPLAIGKVVGAQPESTAAANVGSGLWVIGGSGR